MTTLLAQIIAQNDHIQTLSLQPDLSEIESAFARLEGLFQHLHLIHPQNANQTYAWAVLDQQARTELSRLRQVYPSSDLARMEAALMALLEKIEYAVTLLF
ncbi:hypothetical protein GO755_40445 [Spirosoma sp. HMF4905]|uniref:Uncharacterized protein n=1 Tax=Spirosoma arboris TaxID=2682092 RepID=A0A7K1SRL0_9BACT|nr:hypothetical protein [Spirosoma arboris]MVM36343.1 hypothetical protein [Spirosoma arboris]